MSEPPFPSQWQVSADAVVEEFSVTVPRLTVWDRLQNEMKVENANQVALPKYLRLHMRRPGLRGKLVQRRFVLQVKPKNGANNAELIVSTALSAWCPPAGTRIKVSVADKGNFGLSRFTRQSGAMFGVVGVPVGGALAAAAALPAAATIAPALVIGGGAVAGLAAVASAVAFWRSRR